jgi:hypothetical protein
LKLNGTMDEAVQLAMQKKKSAGGWPWQKKRSKGK